MKDDGYIEISPEMDKAWKAGIIGALMFFGGFIGWCLHDIHNTEKNYKAAKAEIVRLNEYIKDLEQSPCE